MLTSLKHGNVMVVPGDAQANETARQKGDMRLLKQGGPPAHANAMQNRLARDAFGYMFDDADEVAEDAGIAAKLDALGDAMIADGLPGPSGLASIITFFGQFIDHDVTANTDRDPDVVDPADFSIDVASLKRNPRTTVESHLANLRKGTLRLDSLYGDAMLAEHGQDMLDAMRDGDKMLMGQTPGGQEKDLPRFAQTTLVPDISGIHGGFGPVVADKIALIGDGRNDENLLVAQMHVAMLRLHNAIVATGKNFADARRLTEWVYQWLIVNAYLPALCDAGALSKVMQGNAAKLYRKFAGQSVSGDSAPLPLEFSVAAFRHGHSMVRNFYRLNTTANGNGPATGVISTARDIFERTGRGGLGGSNVLDDDWVIDWANFVDDNNSQLAASPIDGALATGLGDLPNEPDGAHPAGHLKHLAKRNLRRGYVLNLPSAQDLIASIPRGQRPDELTSQQLRGATGGSVLEAQGFLEATPLWYYVLVEAEILGGNGGGKNLGPLGTTIVGETLVGLVVTDDSSYWNAAPGGKNWTPADAGIAISDFSSMLEFAGVK